MRYDPEIHHRQSIRLKAYDYSQPGIYFITICTYNHEHLFGKIADARIILNDAGNWVKQYWLDIPKHFPHATLDEFVVMPNHVHGIIRIMDKNDMGAYVGAIHVGVDFVGANNYSPLQEIPTQQQSQQYSPIQHQNGTSKTIGSIVRGFKIGVTKWFHKNAQIHMPVWQRNYYEHIVRDEMELNRIREYIIHNPMNWKLDGNGDNSHDDEWWTL